MSITSIEAQIVVVFQGVAGFKKVYDHEPSMLEQTPCATIVFRDFRPQPGSFDKRQFEHTWDYRVYVPIGSKPGESLTKIKQLLDSVIDAIGNSLILSETCVMSEISSGRVTTITDKDTPYYMVEGQIQALEER